MAYLTVDIGNSIVKCGIFNSWTPVDHQPDHILEMADIDGPRLEEIIADYAIDRTIVSSVRRQDLTLDTWLDKHNGMWLSHDLELNFINLYETPHTLGLDRLAVVAGGAAIAQDKPFFVIDAGTCITYEWIEPDRRYEGGAISPGLTMRYKAVHHFTGKLPLLEAHSSTANFPEKTTVGAISAGIEVGYIAEITELIRRFNNKYPDSIIFLCGGDAEFIQNKCPYTMRLEKHLVLLGLLKIMEQNA